MILCSEKYGLKEAKKLMEDDYEMFAFLMGYKPGLYRERSFLKRFEKVVPHYSVHWKVFPSGQEVLLINPDTVDAFFKEGNSLFKEGSKTWEELVNVFVAERSKNPLKKAKLKKYRDCEWNKIGLLLGFPPKDVWHYTETTFGGIFNEHSGGKRKKMKKYGVQYAGFHFVSFYPEELEKHFSPIQSNIEEAHRILKVKVPRLHVEEVFE